MSVERDTRLKERFSNAGRLFVHAAQSKPHYRKLKSGPPNEVLKIPLNFKFGIQPHRIWTIA